ncbi:MAG TPA: tetratricopeptide repeat protein, partial [Verrucomicrobiae bacterium]|nr:tetratricopeptide repeat protein [Verrucomicrobiae bacterium]
MDAQAQTQIREARRLVQARSFDEAAKICEAVSARFPRAAEPYAVMAETLLHANTPVRALRVLSHIAASDRNSEVEALTAEAQYQLGAYRLAAEAAERAREGNVATLARAARILAAVGQNARALDIFQTLYALDPAAVRGDLAAFLHVHGDVQGAERLYRDLINVGTDKALAWFSLSQLRPGVIDPRARAQLEQELTHASNVHDAVLYAHAIAKSYEDEGSYERALAVLAGPRRAMRAFFEYNFDTFDAPMFQAAKASVSVSGASSATQQPIFVIGLPRSGTTLVERILATHGDVVSIGEADAFARAIKR